MYVSKKDKSKLLKNKAGQTLAERIVRVANTFDNKGYTQISDKLDEALERLRKQEN